MLYSSLSSWCTIRLLERTWHKVQVFPGSNLLDIDCQCLVDVSALSEARFHKSVKSGEVLFARSIEPFEGGR